MRLNYKLTNLIAEFDGGKLAFDLEGNIELSAQELADQGKLLISLIGEIKSAMREERAWQREERDRAMRDQTPEEREAEREEFRKNPFTRTVRGSTRIRYN